jgi:hypothetical protein
MTAARELIASEKGAKREDRKMDAKKDRPYKKIFVCTFFKNLAIEIV